LQVALDQMVDRERDLRSFLGRCFCPVRESFLGGGSRKIDFFLATVGGLGVRLAGPGLDIVEETSSLGFQKFPADKIQNGRVSHDELDRNIERFLDCARNDKKKLAQRTRRR